MSLLTLLEDAYEYIKNNSDKWNINSVHNINPPIPVSLPELNKNIIGHQTMSRLGKIALAGYEALSNTKYLDSVDVQTISLGLTRADIHDLNEWPWEKFVSDADCCALYNNKLQAYINAVNHELKVPVSQNEFDALVSITYNIGTGDLIHDKGGMAGSTFMDLVNEKAPASDVVKAMSVWNRGTINGKRVVIRGLINRRQKEADLYLYGKYPVNGKISRITVDQFHKPHYSSTVDVSQYF